MPSVSFARRAAHLPTALPAPAATHTIAFDSGQAFPGVLPDLTRESESALTRHRSETLQYAPRAGLPDLRRWIAPYLASDAADVPAEDVLVTNAAKHPIELVCRVSLYQGDEVFLIH